MCCNNKFITAKIYCINKEKNMFFVSSLWAVPEAKVHPHFFNHCCEEVCAFLFCFVCVCVCVCVCVGVYWADTRVLGLGSRVVCCSTFVFLELLHEVGCSTTNCPWFVFHLDLTSDFADKENCFQRCFFAFVIALTQP